MAGRPRVGESEKERARQAASPLTPMPTEIIPPIFSSSRGQIQPLDDITNTHNLPRSMAACPFRTRFYPAHRIFGRAFGFVLPAHDERIL